MEFAYDIEESIIEEIMEIAECFDEKDNNYPPSYTFGLGGLSSILCC